MTRREWTTLHAIIGELEALQNRTKDTAAKERLQAAKSELMRLLGSEP